MDAGTRLIPRSRNLKYHIDVELIEVIWRHLLDNTARGHRHWAGLSELAGDLGIHPSTVHRSLKHPIEIGAVENTRLGGLEVLDPARLLMLFGAHRRLSRHITSTHTIQAPTHLVEASLGRQGVTLGGFSALVHHAGGVNRIADFTTIVAYGNPDLTAIPFQGNHTETTLLILDPDPWMPTDMTYTTAGHAWADLFSLPGWQPARFISETSIHAITEPAEPVLLI